MQSIFGPRQCNPSRAIITKLRLRAQADVRGGSRPSCGTSVDPPVEREAIMNKNPGIIGKKIGMTQIFDDKGEVIRCTVVQGGCVLASR